MDKLILQKQNNHEKGDRINVNIYNQGFVLSTEDRDPHFVERVAKYVDSQMQEIAKTSNVVDTRKVAILAALYIAEELLKLKDKEQALNEDFSGQIKDMIGLLDEALK